MQMALLERHEAWLWMPHLPHSHTLEHTHRTTILDSSFLTPSQTTAYFISPVSLPRTPRPARDLCRKRRVCGRIYGSACYFPRASFNSSIKLKPSRRLCHFRRDLRLGNLAPPGGSKGSVIQRLWVGTKAPPRPHCGTQAARALLLGPGGSPEQGCGPLERWGAARAAASKVVSTMLRHSRVLVTGHWTSSKETGCIVWPSALRAKTTPSSADAVVT